MSPSSPMPKQEFSQMMGALKVAIPRFSPEINAPLLNIWYDIFKDYSRKTMQETFQFAVRRMSEFPSIAEFKFVADEFSGKRDEIYRPVPKAQLEEGEVDRLIAELAAKADVTKRITNG